MREKTKYAFDEKGYIVELNKTLKSLPKTHPELYERWEKC